MHIKNTIKIWQTFLVTMAFFGSLLGFSGTAQANTICTADAMMCSDGSYVGRTGPSCEFVCPVGNDEEDNEEMKRQELITELKAKIKEIKARIEVLIAQRNDLVSMYPDFTYNMSIGSRDSATNGEVAKLQNFLIKEGVYPEALVTGYYGELTAKAVRAWMEKYDLKTEPYYRTGSFNLALYGKFIKNNASSDSGAVEQKPCTREYMPVCGEVQPNSIRCIQAPCPSNQILETYPNKCVMENAGVSLWHEGACAGDIKETVVVNTGDLKVFQNEQELQDFLNQNSQNQNSRSISQIAFMDNDFGIAEEMAMADVAAPTISASKQESASGGSSDFSTTNTQVEGIDEADIVKTDGRYIYTLSQGRKISIVDAQDPENMEIASTLDAEQNENIQTMYLYDDKLVLITDIWENEIYPEPVPLEEEDFAADEMILKTSMPYYGGNKNYTRIEIFNVSNPHSPKKERTIEFEGNLNNSRVTNGHLYMLTNKYFYNGSPIMPLIRVQGQDVTSMFGTSFYYIDEPYYSPNILSLSAVNLDAPEEMSTKRVLMPYAGNMYVSQNNIYLTHATYMNQYEVMVDIQNSVFKDLINLSSDDESLISRIKNTDNDIMSDWEKNQKIAEVYRKYELSLDKEELEDIRKEVAKRVYDKYLELKKEFQKTNIEKFSLNKTGITPIASGEISGTLLNQFSMHEKEVDGEEFFYAATTNNNAWLPWQLRNVVENNVAFESENNLYALDKNLNLADGVEGLAEGERIYSTRFIGDNAYMVTFRQVDPLFNIDISDPYDLEVLGELKIPGFSQYLHPYEDDRLIGLGRDVTVDDNGNVRNAGIKVTLFDISEDAPKEIESIHFGKEGSYSEALNNHKAVLVSDSKDIMAFPATLYRENGYDYNSRENVVILLKLEKDGISVISEIPNDQNWQSQTQRTLYIDDVLYSIAPAKILANDLDDAKARGSIKLEEIQVEDWLIKPMPLIFE